MFLALVFNTSTPGQPILYLLLPLIFNKSTSWTNRDSTLSLALVFNTSTLRIDSWTTETLPCSRHWFSTHKTPGPPRLYLVSGTGFQHIRLLDHRDSTLFPGTGFQRIDSWTTETLPCPWRWFSTHGRLDKPRLYLLPGTGFQDIDYCTTETLPSPWHWFSTHRLLDNRDSTLLLALVFNTSTPGQPRLFLVPGAGFQHMDAWTTETLPCPWRWFSTHRLLDNRDATFSLALVFNASTPGQPRRYLLPSAGFQRIDSQNRLLDNRDSTLSLALVFNTSTLRTLLDNRDSALFLALVLNTSTPGKTETLPSQWHWFSTHRLLDNRDATLFLALVFNASTPGQPRLHLVSWHWFSTHRLLDNRDSTLSLALVFNT